MRVDTTPFSLYSGTFGRWLQHQQLLCRGFSGAEGAGHVLAGFASLGKYQSAMGRGAGEGSVPTLRLGLCRVGAHLLSSGEARVGTGNGCLYLVFTRFKVLHQKVVSQHFFVLTICSFSAKRRIYWLCHIIFSSTGSDLWFSISCLWNKNNPSLGSVEGASAAVIAFTRRGGSWAYQNLYFWCLHIDTIHKFCWGGGGEEGENEDDYGSVVIF